LQIEAVIDTGYTAFICLTQSQIESLGLPWQGIGRGILADGSECLFDVFAADVIWDGQAKHVLVDESNSDPLVGMALMRGFELRIEVRSGGKVQIEALNDWPE
jgi:clan AA aspartic protease